MGSLRVIDFPELVQECLEFVNSVGFGSGGKPFLQSLVEPLDFPLGLWVVGSGIFLFNTQSGKENLVSVSAPLQSRGEDQAIVGEAGLGEPIVFRGPGERLNNSR